MLLCFTLANLVDLKKLTLIAALLIFELMCCLVQHICPLATLYLDIGEGLSVMAIALPLFSHSKDNKKKEKKKDED